MASPAIGTAASVGTHGMNAACGTDRPLAAGAEAPVMAGWHAMARSGSCEEEVTKRLAAQFKLPVANFADREPSAIKVLPEKVARKYHVFPLRATKGTLVVASSDPVDLGAEQAIAFSCGRRVMLEVASPGRIEEAIALAYGNTDVVDQLLRSMPDAPEPEVRVVEWSELVPDVKKAAEEGPVIKLTNLVIAEAIKARASDIHIESDQDGGRVRFRVDGVLERFMRLPLAALVRLVSRIKVLGNMDIADHMRPQDGRIRITLGTETFDLRVSTVPTTIGEKCVMRISRSQHSFSLDALDLLPREISGLRALLKHRTGIVIITGPTGSGKTTTLYSALQDLAIGALNVSTVEEPVEQLLNGITQIQVDEKQGRTFAGALRALLRQDPDVILVGEMRDLETAETAVRASMTGHLVLTTLHTNDAIGTTHRLMDIGLDCASIAATLRGVVAQRLVRRLCSHCARPVTCLDDLPEAERALADAYDVLPGRTAPGCDQCRDGYLGRIAIMEILDVSPELSDIIGHGGLAADLRREADRQGMHTLRDSALDRVRMGDTSLEEVERVLGASACAIERPHDRSGTVLSWKKIAIA